MPTNRNNNTRRKNKNKNKNKNRNKNKTQHRNNVQRLRIRTPSPNRFNENGYLYVSPVSPANNFYAVSPNTPNLTPKSKQVENLFRNRQTLLKRAHSYEGQNEYTLNQLEENLKKITKGLETP